MALDPLEKAERRIIRVAESAIADPGGKNARRLAAMGAMVTNQVVEKVFAHPDVAHHWKDVALYINDVIINVTFWAVGGEVRDDLLRLAREPREQFKETFRQLSEFEIQACQMVEDILYGTISLHEESLGGKLGIQLGRDVGAQYFIDLITQDAAGLLAEVDNTKSDDEHQADIYRIVTNLMRLHRRR